MRQQEVFNKIGGIIRELNEQYTYVELSGDLFNDLEFELMAANAHFLSDHVEILRKINRGNEKPQPVTEKLPEALPPPVSERREAPPQPLSGSEEISNVSTFPGGDLEEVTPAVFEFETPKSNPNEVNIIYEMEPEIIRHELIMDETGDDWDEEDNIGEADLTPEPVENVIVLPEVITQTTELPAPEAQWVIPEQKPILPDPLPVTEPKPAAQIPPKVEETPVLTLNERMSAQLASSKADQFASPQPIADLKSAINLNDKLIFIKDLFHGYSLAYSEALDILNRLNNFDEAEKYLAGSYATKNNWADKQATADKFYALLRRRYL